VLKETEEKRCKKKDINFPIFQDRDRWSRVEVEDENIYSRNNQFANAINEGNKC
jgi:hypothetical protein